MTKYHDLSRAQIEQIACALADILATFGFEMMAADCRGDRLQGDLPKYARCTLNVVRRYQPQNVRALAEKLRHFGLAA